MFKIWQSSEQTANTVSRTFGLASSAVKGLAAGLGTSFSIAGLVQATVSAIDFGDAIGDVAERTGLTTTDLQALQFQASQSGNSAEAMASGLQTFARNIGQAQEGIGRMAKQLQALDPIAA